MSYRVVRVMRVAVDTLLFDTFEEAQEMAQAYHAQNPRSYYAVAHETYPLDNPLTEG